MAVSKQRLSYLKKRRRKQEFQERQRRFQQIAGVDIKIYLHKWYPWSYKNYIPTLVLQGWYNLDRAKQFFLNKYGPEALQYVKFSKGKTILESGDFKVGKTLYINGMWRNVSSKTYRLSEGRNKAYSSLRFKQQLMMETKKRTRGHNDRVHFDKEITCYQHGRTFIRKNTKKEDLKLQKIQQVNRERKKTLFEEPS